MNFFFIFPFFLLCIVQFPSAAAVSFPSFLSLEELQNLLKDQKKISSTPKEATLLNVSYDPTREFYEEINGEFARWWKERTNQTITIYQSHAGSGKQARSVAEGLEADVVTLALALDIDAIQSRSHLLSPNWEDRLPNHSVPFTSTIIFLVREGNPKKIKDWDDLIRKDISVITPNPKTSGGARWNYLAAWGYAWNQYSKEEEKVKEFMQKLYKNVSVLDSGARAATTTFVQREMGDVLIAWENEAHLAMKRLGAEKFDLVFPSISIKAEPPVAWIDRVIDKKGTREVAEYYLAFLYTRDAQKIAADFYFRPVDEKVLGQYRYLFPVFPMITIEDFGGWKQAQEKHFKDGGVFDQIYQ